MTTTSIQKSLPAEAHQQTPLPCPKTAICEGGSSRYTINTCKMGKDPQFTYRMTGPCVEPDKNNHFPNVAIVGAGIAGLVIAYEMVNAWKRSNPGGSAKDLPVKIYEKSTYAGGKIVGYFDDKHRPVEHSTRVLYCFIHCSF